jgi:hypothetical protein
MKVLKNTYDLQPKSSLFYDPLAESSIVNGGDRALIMLIIDIYRPFEDYVDILNYVAIRAIGESAEVEHACKLAILEGI